MCYSHTSSILETVAVRDREQPGRQQTCSRTTFLSSSGFTSAGKLHDYYFLPLTEFIAKNWIILKQKNVLVILSRWIFFFTTEFVLNNFLLKILLFLTNYWSYL